MVVTTSLGSTSRAALYIAAACGGRQDRKLCRYIFGWIRRGTRECEERTEGGKAAGGCRGLRRPAGQAALSQQFFYYYYYYSIIIIKRRRRRRRRVAGRTSSIIVIIRLLLLLLLNNNY